jgi:hypothetical protein
MSTFCPQCVFMCFAIRINSGSFLLWRWRVVFCEVRAEHFDIISINIVRQGRVMTQAVSRRLSAAEARVQSQTIPCENCGGQSGIGTGFPPSTLVSAVIILLRKLHILLHLRLTLIRRTSGDAWEQPSKRLYFRCWGAHGQASTLTLCAYSSG